MRRMLGYVVLIGSSLLLLTACGGGGGDGVSTDMMEARLLPFPFDDALDESHYAIGRIPPQSAANARQMPVYHDDDDRQRLFVGVDQGTEHVGQLDVVGNRDDVEIRHGRLNDGVGAETMATYLSQVVDIFVLRYKSRPLVRFGGAASTADIDRLVRAVQLVNAALPPEWKMRIPSDMITSDPGTGIYVDFVPESEFHRNSCGG